MDISKLTLYTNNRSKVYSDKLRVNLENVLKRVPTSSINNIIDSYTSEIMKTGSCITVELTSSYEKFRAETYNALMDEIKLDLKSLYTELDTMIALLNNLSYVVETYYKESEDNINILNSRIRALTSLQSSSKEYDEIVFETFTNQTNVHNGGSPMTIPNESGIMRLPVDEHMSVYAEENDADITFDILNKVTLLNYKKGIPSETDPALALVKEVFTDKLQSCTYTIGIKNSPPVTRTYNGVVGIVSLSFPSSRHFNNISFNPYSNAELDILGIYYTNALQGSYTDSIWEPIDVKYDTDNFNAYEFNFEQKLGRRIIIVLGQSHYRTETIKLPKEIFNITNRENLSIATIERNRLKEYREIFARIFAMTKSYKTNEQIQSALYSNNLVNTIGSVDERIQTLLLALDNYINKEENQYLEIKVDLYKLGLYSLDIQYNNYRANAYFESKPLSFNKNIRKLQIYVDQSNDTDKNITEWSFDINGESYPILPYNLYNKNDVIIDAVTVFDVNQRTYNTKFLALSSGFTLKINGVILNSSKYTQHLLSTSYLDRITFKSDVILNRDDVITFHYRIPEKTKFDIDYDPTQLDLDKYVKPPHIEYMSLYNINNSLDASALLLASGQYSPVWPNENIIPYSYEGKTIYVLDADLNPLVNLYTEIAGPLQITENTERFYINDPSFIRQNKKHYYNGVYGETVTLEYDENNEYYQGYMSTEYMIGTLTVLYNDIELKTDQSSYLHPGIMPPPPPPNPYPITTIRVLKSNEPYLPNSSITVTCIYSPLYPVHKPAGYVSNIKSHNYEESFNQTSETNTVELQYKPHLDNYIVSESIATNGDWLFVDGSFIHKNDTSIIYQPITVYVNGQLVRNRTNYQDTQTSKNMDLETYNSTLNNIEYYQSEKTLFFNTKIVGNIQVKYYKAESGVSVKAQSIRYTKTDDTITPAVYSYAVLADLE